MYPFIFRSLLAACLLCTTHSLLGQCAFEDLFGPIDNRIAPQFRELPVRLPDQDVRSPACENSSSGIDPGEYLEIEMDGHTIEAFSLANSSSEWFINGQPTGTNNGASAILGSYNGTAQLADQISDPTLCDPEVAPNRNVAGENIDLQCLDCPEIPSDIPQQALNGGLDSVYFSNPSFISFSNYPSEGSDPLGAQPQPLETQAWHFFNNPGSTSLLAIHRGNRIPIYPADEITNDTSATARTVLQMNLRAFEYNAPGWYDNYLGLSIINSDGNQDEVLWSTFFTASNTVDFVLPLSGLNPSFAGQYSLQFWTTADYVATFSCNDYNNWPGHYIAFEMNLRNYTPPSPPANDNCITATPLTPTTEEQCSDYQSGTFAYANDSAHNPLLDNCSNQEDVWYQFVANSTQYDFETQLLADNGSYTVQLLRGTDCADLSSIYCEQIDHQAILRFVDLEPGATYYLRFVREFLDDTALDFEFCLRERGSTCFYPELIVTAHCVHNEAYELLVDVTDLGANSQLELQDITQAEPLAPMIITSTGTYTYGPIDATVNFSLLVVADETDCDLLFGDFLPDCSQEPPPNDNCEGAIELVDCISKNFGTATGSRASCVLSNAADVWFQFTPTTSIQSLMLDLPATVTEEEIALEVFSGACDNLQSVYCATGRFHLLNELMAGTPYYVLLKLPVGQEELSICRESYPDIANEDCANAITLPIMANCEPHPFSTTGARPTATPLACEGANSGDVWFSFRATTDNIEVHIDQIMALQSSYTGQLTMSVYRNTCEQLNELACHTIAREGATLELNNLIAGQVYYLRLSASAFDEYFDFNLCLTGTPAPANDVCENAIVLTVSPELDCVDGYTGSTEAAVTPGAVDCNNNPVQDVWFTFQATAEGHLISVSSNDFPEVQAFSGSCGLLEALSDCSQTGSLTLSGLSPGQNYYLRVMSTAGFAADFNLCVLTLPPPPVNDLCSGAITLVAGGSDCPQVQTGDFLSTSSENQDCWGAAMERDLWYQFEATASTQYLQLQQIRDALPPQNPSFASIGFEYYEGTCANLTSLGCTSDLSFSEGVMEELQNGQTYYIRLFIDNSSAAAAFDLCLSDLRPPLNDESSNAIVLVQQAEVWCTEQASGMLAGATSSLASTDCAGQTATANDDVWYRFVAATTDPNIEVEYFWGDYRLELFADDATTRLDCTQGGLLSTTGLTIGATYFLRVYSATDQALTPSEGSFRICVYGLPSEQISTAASGSCTTTSETVVSTGANRWLYLTHQGELVAAIFDSEPLGVITTAFYQNTVSIRANDAGIEYMDRNFSISPAQQPTQLIRVRLYYTQAEFDAFLAANDGDANDPHSFIDIVVSRFPGASCSTVVSGNGLLHPAYAVGTLSSGYYVDILVDHFSAFFLHSGQQALPMELGLFTAKEQAEAIQLKWTTLSETDHAGFTIERSLEGRSFSPLAWINGQGNPQAETHYQYLDEDLSPNHSTYFYRLRQTDIDGQFTYSSVVKVVRSFSTQQSVVFYPNPSTGQVQFDMPRTYTGDIWLYNQLGQCVLQWHSADVEVGTPIDLSHLPPGNYWARLQGKQGDTQPIRLILL